jgi:hypothetical protein
MASVFPLAINLVSPIPIAAGVPSFSVFALNGATDALEFAFQPPAGITITHLGFRYGVRTGTPPVYRISLQTLVNGVPNGTVLGGGSPASATFTPPADTTWNSTWQWVALSNSYVTTGIPLAMVIDYSSGTIDGSNTSSFTSVMSQGSVPSGMPYAIQNDATVRTNVAQSAVFGYKTASSVHGLPIEAVTATTFSSNSTPDEYALRFVLPTTLGDTYTIRGIRYRGQPAAAGKTALVQLYDTDGSTVLQNVTIDSDNVRAVAESANEVLFDETTLSVLDCGSVYRIGIQSQETASNWNLRTLDVDSNAELAAFPLGTVAYLSTRADAGSWTDFDNRLPVVELILADLVLPAGGAGGTGISRGRIQLGM